MTVFEVLLSSLASQAFTEGECNSSDKTPLNFSYFKVSEFLRAFVDKFRHFWKCLSVCHSWNLFSSNNVLASDDLVEHHILYWHLQSSLDWHFGLFNISGCKFDALSFKQNFKVDVTQQQLVTWFIELTKSSEFSVVQKGKQYYSSHQARDLDHHLKPTLFSALNILIVDISSRKCADLGLLKKWQFRLKAKSFLCRFLCIHLFLNC